MFQAALPEDEDALCILESLANETEGEAAFILFNAFDHIAAKATFPPVQ
jgi:hypothetical protein